MSENQAINETPVANEKKTSVLRKWFFFVVFVLLLIFYGATLWNQGTRYGYVTGTITIDGQPAPAGIAVSFQPKSISGSPSLGVTNSEGRYEMKFTYAQKGVQIGPCYVRFAPYSSEDEKVTLTIPKNYSEGIDNVVHVKPGDQTFDFDIKIKNDVSVEQGQDGEPTGE